MKRSLVLVLCAVVSTGCAQQPELPADQPLPESWGATPAGGAALTATDPSRAVTAAFDAVIATGGIRLLNRSGATRVDIRYAPGRAVGMAGAGLSRRVDVRRVGSAVFVKSEPAFWRRTAVAGSAARIGTSWVRFTRDDDRAGGMLMLSDFEAYLGAVLDPGRWDRWGQRRSVRGIPAIAVIDDQRTGSVLYLAATGKPLPLLLESDDSSLEFLEPGKPARTEAPAGAIDGDRLPAG